MPLTDSGAAATLNSILGSNHSSLWPGTVYIGLSTTNPATSVTEPSGNAYARFAVVNNSTNFPDVGTPRIKYLATLCTFPTATGSWGALTHYGIFSAVTGGTLLAHGSMLTPQTVINGDTVTIAANALSVSVP